MKATLPASWVERLTRTVLVASALLLPVPPASADSDGVFTSEAGRFRVAFPGQPREDDTAASGRHHRVRSVVDGVTYLVDWADLTAEEIHQARTPEILLHRLRDSLARDKPVLMEKTRSIGQSPGIELVLDAGSGNRSIFHIYDVGSRLYTIAVTGKTERLRTQQQVLERFYESFQVRTVPPQKSGKLAVDSAEPRYGRLGPRRKEWRYRPYDVVNARLWVTGFATDAEGQFDLEATTEVLTAADELLSRVPSRMRGAAIQESLPIDVVQDVPTKPGEYHIRVALHDARTDERVVWEQKLTVLPAEMAIVAPAFFRDADAKVPSPAFGHVGQRIFLELRVIGFDRSHDRIDTALTLHLVDEAGKPLLDEPVTSAFTSADPQIVRSNEVVTYTVGIPLPRVAKTTVRATVADTISGKSVTLEMPLEIHEP